MVLLLVFPSTRKLLLNEQRLKRTRMDVKDCNILDGLDVVLVSFYSSIL